MGSNKLLNSFSLVFWSSTRGFCIDRGYCFVLDFLYLYLHFIFILFFFFFLLFNIWVKSWQVLSVEHLPILYFQPCSSWSNSWYFWISSFCQVMSVDVVSKKSLQIFFTLQLLYKDRNTPSRIIFYNYVHKVRIQETVRITIGMICSTLALLRKFQYFWRPIYNLVKHLRWSFYGKNSKKLHKKALS